MLEDYNKYLLNIRNSLIQCGVGLDVKPVESYEDTLATMDVLNSALWYYSVLGICGSDSAIRGFFLPLTGNYKEKLRMDCYKEFLGYIPDYKKISKSGLTPKKPIHCASRSHESVFNGDYTGVVSEETSVSDGGTLCESAEVESSNEYTEDDEEYATNGVYLEDCTELVSTVEAEVSVSEDVVYSDEDEYQEHGRYVEEYVDTSDGVETHIAGVDTDYVEHGIILEFVQDIGDDDDDDDIEGGFELDEGSDIYNTENSETYDDEEGIQYDENGFEVSDEDFSYADEDELDEEGYYEGEEGLDESFEHTEEGIEYDESGFEVSDEDDLDEDFDYNEGEEGLDESFEYTEDDESSGDLDESFEYADDEEGLDESFEYSDEEYEDSEDLDESFEYTEEEGVEYDESGFEVSDESDLDENGFEIDESFDSKSEECKEQPEIQSQSRIEDQRDMADALQDITSNMVHKGRKALKKIGKSLVGKI